MSNLVKSSSNNFLELQSIINQAMVEQNSYLNKMLQEVADKQNKMDERLNIIESENENIRDLEIKRHRVAEHRYGYVSLSDLGQCYQVSIGSKTMGKLLRLAGIAKSKQSKTEPLRSSVVHNYAKSIMYGDYPAYQWNPEKCIEKIDRWLDKIEAIDQFYAIESEKEVTAFVNKLYEKYWNEQNQEE